MKRMILNKILTKEFLIVFVKTACFVPFQKIYYPGKIIQFNVNNYHMTWVEHIVILLTFNSIIQFQLFTYNPQYIVTCTNICN